jgi:hypothetical protein
MSISRQSGLALAGEVEQRRFDPPADVVGLTQVELREDAVDVPLDGALRDDELLRDGGIAASLRDQPEDLELAWR